MGTRWSRPTRRHSRSRDTQHANPAHDEKGAKPLKARPTIPVVRTTPDTAGRSGMSAIHLHAALSSESAIGGISIASDHSKRTCPLEPENPLDAHVWYIVKVPNETSVSLNETPPTTSIIRQTRGRAMVWSRPSACHRGLFTTLVEGVGTRERRAGVPTNYHYPRGPDSSREPSDKGWARSTTRKSRALINSS